MTTAERFWSKVDRSGGPDACWPWLAQIAPDGYGKFRWSPQRNMYAHRASWLLAHGVEPGPCLDHACHNIDALCPGGSTCLHRRCVNPAHLESVTTGENLTRSPHTGNGRNARKTHCKRGHAFDTITSSGHRRCKQCQALHQRNHRARLRGARTEE